MGRVGTPFADFMRYNARRGEYGPGDVEEQVASRIEAARSFAPHAMERERPNGQIIAVRGTPLPDGGFITVYTDITEQRYYERLIETRNEELDRRVRERTAELEAANAEREEIAQALARSEGRLRLITDAIPALIAYVDRDRVYRFANKGYAAWFGRSKEDILGRSVAEVTGARAYAAIGPQMDVAETGRSVSYEYATEQPGRGTVYARSTLVPEFGEDGAVVGFFVLSSDVTEQKKTQAALLQAQKMEAVGKLTGGLAHDFNNLLTIVIGNLAALGDRMEGRSEVGEFLEPAIQAARRGADITRRLLAFSRRQPLEPRPVEVDRLVTGMVALLRRSVPELVEIRIEEPATPVVAEVDVHQLENALLNLALNARDAMPDGGRLTFTTDAVVLDHESAAEAEVEPGRYVRIRVADTGVGMDEGTLARAFEPFFTSKGAGVGSGLGLSMVYGFVRQSGGAIRMVSRVGGGTTATILLPASDKAPAPEQKPAAPARPTPGRLVLLVEDEPEVRRVIRQQLRDRGYLVLEAGDGTEALRLLEAVPDVEVLVSDVMMPGGPDGRDLAESARRRRPDLRIVLISGYPGGHAGGDSVPLDVPLLQKPFARDDLVAAIEGATL